MIVATGAGACASTLRVSLLWSRQKTTATDEIVRRASAIVPGMSSRAPVALFTFNRPDHTHRTLEALCANALASETDLIVFCDGPRSEADRAKTESTRAVVRAASGFASVRVVERPANLGLAQSVITGVGDVLDTYDRLIVVEDDMQTAPSFLTYMNTALTLYADDARVISVCGYTPRLDVAVPDTYFLPGAHCWGWGTWRRGWALFNPDARALFDAVLARNLIYEFDVEGSESLTTLLYRSASGDTAIDSWALRWMASAIVHDTVTLYPAKSLLLNMGFDGSGTHGAVTEALSTDLADRALTIERGPATICRPALDALRRVLIRWRAEESRRTRLFYSAFERLPRPIRRRVYVWKTKDTLRRMASSAVSAS